MTIAFDGSNRIIQLGGGDFAVDAADIYADWKDWVLAGNAQFPPAFRSIGGDPLGGGASAGAYFFLNNIEGWRIRPEAVDHELTLSGNLFGEDSGAPVFLPTIGDFQVLLKQVTSSLTQQLSIGSGLSPDQAAQLANVAAAISRIDSNTGIIPALL